MIAAALKVSWKKAAFQQATPFLPLGHWFRLVESRRPYRRRCVNLRTRRLWQHVLYRYSQPVILLALDSAPYPPCELVDVASS